MIINTRNSVIYCMSLNSKQHEKELYVDYTLSVIAIISWIHPSGQNNFNNIWFLCFNDDIVSF